MKLKFKNTQKRKCGDVPEVIEKWLKFGKLKKDVETNPRKPNVWGVKNFLLQTPEGEDDRTTEMYIVKIKEAHKQHPYNRKLTLINTAMDKSFALRRSMVVEPKPVADILDLFPILSEPSEVRIAYLASYILIYPFSC